MKEQATSAAVVPRTEREAVMAAKAAAGRLKERLSGLSPSARGPALRLVAQSLGQELIAQFGEAIPTTDSHQPLSH